MKLPLPCRLRFLNTVRCVNHGEVDCADGQFAMQPLGNSAQPTSPSAVILSKQTGEIHRSFDEGEVACAYLSFC
jgi:hypothetical protein